MHYHARINIRLFALAVVTIAAFAGLISRLYWVQVFEHEEYAARVASRSEARVRIPPIRGEIRDCRGVRLAQNRASYEVEFYLPELVRGFRDQATERIPTVNYRARVHGMLAELREPDIIHIVNQAVLPRLSELGLDGSYDPQRLAFHYRTRAEVPFTYLENLDFRSIAKISENNLDLRGVDIAIQPVRFYPMGSLACHLLGYVGAPREISNLPDVGEFDYYDPNVSGQSDIEFYLDRALQGKPGVRVMERNVKGAIDRIGHIVPPEPGANVYLTIDSRIQYVAERSLRAIGRGAAVVVDPSNGNILAMASVPSYDPNVFTPRISPEDWRLLTQDEADPLVNRAICAFPPGSTFKLITSLAGLSKGIANRHFTCSGGVSYGDHYFKCWISGRGSHGNLGLSDAVKVSCNAFFYQYGNAAGINAIDAVGELLGLGKPTGIPVTGEQAGILPGPDWLRSHFPRERWSSAYTANVSIGQGYDLVTPLQLVMAYSALANGGTSYYPRLVKQILDKDRKPLVGKNGRVLFPDVPRVRGRLSDLGIESDDLAMLRGAFLRVVEEDGGTARRARIPGVHVAGKTGTAQNQRDGHDDTISWFVCFAPFEAPKYAVCVMVEGGAHGGTVAAPIAARILQESLAMDAGTWEPDVKPLRPARKENPFQMIELVSFDTEGPSVTAGAEPSPQDSEPVASVTTSGSPAPIAEGPDNRRRVLRAQPVRPQRVYRAQPVETAEPERGSRRPGFFQRLFRRR